MAYLKEIREKILVEGVHIQTVIFEMKAHFLYYFTACENVHNPIVSPISSTVQEASIYSEDEVASPTVMSEHQTNIYMNERVSQEFRTFQEAVNSSWTLTDFLGWYQGKKSSFSCSRILIFCLHRPKMRGTFLLLVCL